jgi:hypothetical protein
VLRVEWLFEAMFEELSVKCHEQPVMRSLEVAFARS